jgi:hypothetical protein
MEVSCQFHAPTGLLPGKEHPATLRRLGVSQSWSGRCGEGEKSLTLPGIEHPPSSRRYNFGSSHVLRERERGKENRMIVIISGSTGTSAVNRSGRAPLRREQWERHKREDRATPLGYSGRTALRREQCDGFPRGIAGRSSVYLMQQ